MKRRVVVTGIGMVTPGGVTQDAIWEHLLTGRTAGLPTAFDGSPYPALQAGSITDESVMASFPARVAKRMDRFCCLAMAAAEKAIADSALDSAELDREQVGCYLGNMYGGWGMTEPNLRNLLREGYQMVSPYVASAWFPTAAQGQISIQWRFKGLSKTIVADTASSALAVGYAARAIQDGRIDVALAGGAEAPINPYTIAFCAQDGRLSSGGYHPFDRSSGGFTIGEGAVILVLEERERAISRGATLYGELVGWATGYLPARDAPWSDGGRRLARVITQALREAEVDPKALDYVGLDAQGVPEADQGEAAALDIALGQHRAACYTCKPALTHLLGAGAASEIAVALLAMQRGIVPPLAPYNRMDVPHLRELVTGGVHARAIGSALVNARGQDGVQAALVFRAVDP